uniref:NADH:ubiquinone oxidoreductase intermediate-associated protein 30 domain-containing protein n=1 Tax=Picochlorum oklahomense TaxID=249345 RepID=A0A7S1CWA5_9CHLO|mmetsp:Transcript_1539/g.3170  ORF Transcript_1539/g.3170 Transcript_1539/m.3170 type:complete len:237 (+) Transcript_1539:51-761(+)
MLRRLLKSVQNVAEKVKDPLSTEPFVVFEFKSAQDAARWRVASDSTFGGLSSGTIQVAESQGASTVGRFSGMYSKGIGPNAHPKLKKSGFVSMTGRTDSLSPYIDLESYQSLIYRVKGDGRTYLANLRTDNWVTGGDGNSEDIWQAVLLSKDDGGCDSGWKDVEIPLTSFVLTWKGRVVDAPVELGKTKVTALGISLLGNDEQAEGPFCIEIESIKARHELDAASSITHPDEKEAS